MESQLTLYACPFADFAKGLPESVFIGVWLASLFVDDNLGAGALGAVNNLPLCFD